MSLALPRRRFLRLIGSSCAAYLCAPLTSLAAVPGLRWRGLALGASAEMLLLGEDSGRLKQLCNLCLKEIARLEQIFSLYLPGSVIRQLNSAAALDAPPTELLEVLELANKLSELTEGAFDISIQPLWHYRYYLGPRNPDRQHLMRLRDLVDFRKIMFSKRNVRFATAGMQVTLNGIAQGYITDRVVTILRDEGLRHSLVELGETYALGLNQAGLPWQIGLMRPPDPMAPLSHASDVAPTRIDRVIELTDQALATSGGYGTLFPGASGAHHLINARSGESSNLFGSLSVLARSATVADGLSTALSLVKEELHPKILSAFPEAAVVK